jgi:hypothetical protein
MARPRDLRPCEEGNRLERLSHPVGYTLGEDQRVEDIFAMEAELWRSEGIDPEWPPFDKAKTG